MDNPSIETVNVKNVYEKIARHFDKTRFKVWPSVQKFIDNIPSHSLVLDVGCGNGKNMCRDDIYFIGSDFCQNFANICGSNGKNIIMANSKYLPIKDNSVNYVMCIAMLHHIYREDDQTMVSFNSLDDITAGSRCAHLKGETMPLSWKSIFID